MSKIIVFKDQNGNVSIANPAFNARRTVVEVPAQYYSEGEIISPDVFDENDILIHESVIADGTEIKVPEVTREETDDEFLSWIVAKDLSFGTGHRVIDDSELPADYSYFFDALAFDGKKVSIDLAKARDIQLTNIRFARDQKFIDMGFPVKLDPDLEKAIIPQETRDTLDALRNLPDEVSSDLDAAKSVKAIKDVWPEIVA